MQVESSEAFRKDGWRGRLSRFMPEAPKAFSVLSQGYGPGPLSRDLLSGITVGIVALPLAMAFAIASGASPAQGLVTAIVAGFIISFLGGSRFQIGGPTGAFVVIIYGTIAKYGMDGLLVATLLAGAMLMLFGLCRMGALIKFIPYPVTTGFTAGIGLLIFTQQMKDFLGLQMDKASPEFFASWEAYYANIGTMDQSTLIISGVTLVTIFCVRRWIPRIPAPFVAVVLASVLTAVYALPVDTIGSRFGGIPRALPGFAMPHITLDLVREVFPAAVTIALLAGIESLLSAIVADGMTGDHHNSNTELVAQGLANIASVAMGGIPATGAIARTATNIKAGAFSPVSGMIHALFLVAFVYLLAPLASYIPLASLAGVLVVVAYDMSEPHRFKRLFKAPKSDVVVMLLTFGLTVVVDLTVAVWVGVVLASLLFMRRMSELTGIRRTLEFGSEGEAELLPKELHPDTNELDVPDGVEVYEIDGPFFFGCADRLNAIVRAMHKPPKVLILRMRHVPAIDATAVNSIEALHDKCKKRHVTIVLSGVRTQPMATLKRLGADKLFGQENITVNILQALDRAREIIASEPRPRGMMTSITGPGPEAA
ncbi:SulP family inorganic anion transporter [Desulfocurvibacter africanus]|uniref:SulP family inorganic anion transporter n=1 Tax=Desulfocurvibacter africanus TaxID=873 RepID=UPI0004250998|nr:sulfate permease [Desulfocurvibacter africanus]